MSGPWNDGVAPQLTWANLYSLNPASYGPGQLFYVSDVGIGGSYWYSNGVRWTPLNGSVHLLRLRNVAFPAGGTEVKFASCKIPTGLVAAGRSLGYQISYQKSGATETLTLKCRWGPADDISGTQVFAAVTAASQWGYALNELFRASATTVTKHGNGGIGGHGGAGGVSSTVLAPSNTTLTGVNLDSTDSYFAFTSAFSATTETGIATTIALELLDGA